jgi:hypothetical protein
MPEAVAGRAGGCAPSSAVSGGVPPIGLAAVAGLSLVAAGSGGSSRNGVAQVASTQRTTTGAELSAGAKSDADLAYSVRMRKHGVPKFPDPEVASSGVRVPIDKSACRPTGPAQ